MSVRITTCPTCGEQTGVYEAGRIESVAANKCKCPPAPAPRTVTEERWMVYDPFLNVSSLVLYETEEMAQQILSEHRRIGYTNHSISRVTLTYTVPGGGR